MMNKSITAEKTWMLQGFCLISEKRRYSIEKQFGVRSLSGFPHAQMMWEPMDAW